jgi:hypothetical protein
MKHKYDKINVDKLKFQKHILEAALIKIQVPNYGMCDISRENILLGVSANKEMFLDKIDYYFTATSIKVAMKPPPENTKKDESKNK